jgi:acyl carrier protein
VVHDEVRDIFATIYNLDLPAGRVDLDEPLFGPASAYGLDSLDTLRFIAALQEAYGFDIAACGTDTFRTVRGIAEFITAQSGAAQSGPAPSGAAPSGAAPSGAAVAARR